MKAMYRPPKPQSKFAKDVRRHIQVEVDRYLEAKKRTMADRICAMMCITLNNEFGFGAARLDRFWRAFQKDVRGHLQDMEDTGDDLLFLRLRRIGMERLAEVVMDDYEAEREAVRGSVFDTGEEKNDGKTVSRSDKAPRPPHPDQTA